MFNAYILCKDYLNTDFKLAPPELNHFHTVTASNSSQHFFDPIDQFVILRNAGYFSTLVEEIKYLHIKEKEEHRLHKQVNKMKQLPSKNHQSMEDIEAFNCRPDKFDPMNHR